VADRERQREVGAGQVNGSARPASGQPRVAKPEVGDQNRQDASPSSEGDPGGRRVTCREFSDFIVDYLSGDLAADSRAQFDRHLSRCTNCQRYLTSYEESVKLGRRAFDDPEAQVPAEVPEDLVKAILAARPRR
jgi:anti-sigma factor RsiW